MSDAEENVAHESLSTLYAYIQQVNFLHCVGQPGRHLYQTLHARLDEGCEIFEKRFGQEWAPF